MRKLILIYCLFLIFNMVVSAQHANVGEKAPSINADVWLNHQINTNSLKGKTIVLDFWFVDCPPCIKSIPHLNNLATMYKKANVVFLAITFDKKEKVEKFMAKTPIVSYVGIDTLENTAKAFQVSLYPKTFVIDSKGIIRWKGSPMNLNESILKPILQK